MLFQHPAADGQLHERTPLISTSENDVGGNTGPKSVHGVQDVHYKNISGGRFWCLLASVLVAYTVVYFDSFFMAASHPVITSYFNASNAASWLSTVFYLSMTIFGPFYGRVSDVTGRRVMYVFALIIFAITTAWCGRAGSIGSFIAARFFCGLGAGGVATMANIILSDIVKIEYRGIYQSYLNVCFGLGNGLGASLGGVICDSLGWRAAFYVQVPLILAFTICGALATPNNLGPCLAKAEGKTITKSLASFDFGGAVALALTITGLILGINLGGSILSWTHPIVIVSLITFVLAAFGLVMLEKRARLPILPLGLLSITPYAQLNWGNLLGAMLSSTMNFNIPLFLQAVKLVSPTTSGLVMLSPLIGISLTSVAVGFAISWTRKLKPYMTVGALSQFGGIIACGLFLHPETPWSIIILTIPWVSIGQGLFFPATTVSTLALSSDDEQAVVVTTLNLTRSLGTIVGVAVSSLIFQNLLPMFLRQNVAGSRSEVDRIIREVRTSIHAISKLSADHKEQVIRAYSHSLSYTFLGCGLLGLVLCIVMLPVHIPDLQSASKADTEDQRRTAEDGVDPGERATH